MIRVVTTKQTTKKQTTIKKANKATKDKAKKMIHQTMIDLKEQFPMLIYAINLLNNKNKWKEITEDCKLSTDGEHLFYNPFQVIEDCKYKEKEELKKQLLHIVLHGLLEHFDMHLSYRDRKLLWVVLDREVEYILQEMLKQEGDNYRLRTRNDYFEYEYEPLQEMNDYLGENYHIGCYYKARKDKALRKLMLKDGQYIKRDNHEFWLKQMENKNTSSDGTQGEENQDSQKNKNTRRKMLSKAKQMEISSAWKKASEMMLNHNGYVEQNKDLLLLKLKDNRTYGSGSNNERRCVTANEENENSYYDVLMDFLKVKDTVKEQYDMIDPMLYQYGLELYGDIPLIESSEETEQLQLNTICLAIDTSGSCDGTVARKFLRESYNIIRDLAFYANGGEVYIFICDNKLQQEYHYEAIRDIVLQEWETMELNGWGGTSFVPVFRRIYELEEEGHTIDCLIYLTDGDGEYPEEKPKYPVYFLMEERNMQYWEEDWKYDWEYNIFPKWIRRISFS